MVINRDDERKQLKWHRGTETLEQDPPSLPRGSGRSRKSLWNSPLSCLSQGPLCRDSPSLAPRGSDQEALREKLAERRGSGRQVVDRNSEWEVRTRTCLESHAEPMWAGA